MTNEAKAVKRGAKLLDQLNPSWYRKVNVSQLDLGSPSHCVLGQLSGEFTDGLRDMAQAALDKFKLPKELFKIQGEYTLLGDSVRDALKDVEIDAVHYGFNALSDTDAVSENHSFERLTNQWLREIAARRKARRG